MGRRGAAAAVLAVVVLVVSIGRVLTGVDVRGSAGRLPPPVPPDVGSCGLTRDGVLELVDCTVPHTVEVTAVWEPGADAPPPGYADCRGKAREYIGAAPAGDPSAHPYGEWTLPLRYGHSTMAGPGSVRVAGWSWRVCVVRPAAPLPARGYLGTVRGEDAGTRPAALRPCYVEPDLRQVISCAQGHMGEVIATQAVVGDSDPALGPRLVRERAGCLAAVRAVTGGTDPTFDGQLRVRVLPENGASSLRAVSADTGIYFTAYGKVDWRLCTVEATGGRRLVDTVAGVGAGPLPIG